MNRNKSIILLLVLFCAALTYLFKKNDSHMSKSDLVERSQSHLEKFFQNIMFPNDQDAAKRVNILSKKYPALRNAELIAKIIPVDDHKHRVRDSRKIVELFGFETVISYNYSADNLALLEHNLLAIGKDNSGDIYCLKYDGGADLQIYCVYFPSLYDGKLNDYLRELDSVERFMGAYYRYHENLEAVKRRVGQ